MGKLLTLVATLGLLTSCQLSNAPEILDGGKRAIIGGEKVSVQEFPFLVNIWQRAPQDAFEDHLCGGSLIAAKWVLTAAHCVLEDTTDVSAGTVKASTLSLYIGSDYRDGKGGREFKAKSLFVHPDFNWPLHDIALIELTEAVTNVGPIELNSVKDLGSSKTPLFATSAGWGVTDVNGQEQSSLLQSVRMPIISRDACAKDWLASKWLIGSEILCTTSLHETKAPCQGDSGGPLMLGENGNYKLIGIVSWGHSCRGTNPNLISNVEGFADVADALPWIKKVIN